MQTEAIDRRANSTNVRSNQAGGGRPAAAREAPAALRTSVRALAAVAPDAAAALAARLFLTPPRTAPRAEQRAVLRAAEAWPFLTEEGTQKAYTWSGDDEQPHAVLLHGWGGNAGQLTAFVEPLLAAGFAVTAFDAPAHGEAPGRLTTGVRMARALDAVAARLGAIDTVIAHSFGGIVAAVAMRHGLRVRRAAFLGSPADLEAGSRLFARAVGLPEALAPRFLRRVEQHVGRPYDELRPHHLASPGVPLLLVHDQGDAEVPVSEASLWAGPWTGARVRVTEGLGHRRIVRDEGIVREVVDFAASGRGVGWAL
jgi:pimeloyl-ACP methyl ester carboxylesterase